MAIGTYAELQAQVYAFLLRASTDLVVTSAQVQNYIFLFEAEANRELRVRELEESADLVTVADQDYVALPSDFKKVKDIYHESAPFDLELMASKGELKRKWSTAQGRPSDYAIHGSNVIFGKMPDAVYTIPMDYYKAIPALADDNTTNVILTAYPDLYLYGALRQAYMQIKDAENGDRVNLQYGAIMDRIKAADMESRMPHNLRIRTRGRLA